MKGFVEYLIVGNSEFEAALAAENDLMESQQEFDQQYDEDLYQDDEDYLEQDDLYESDDLDGFEDDEDVDDLYLYQNLFYQNLNSM